MAHHSFRKNENESLVMLGENEEYEPLSRAAFYNIMFREKVRKINVNVKEVVSNENKKA
jgi:thymidine kinase